MDGPVEDDVVVAGSVHELFQPFGFLGRVGLAPVGCAVVGVVFRTVEVDIHLVPSVEVQLAYAVFLAPGGSVESFYHTPVGHIGIVGHFGKGQFVQSKQLGKCLHAVVSSPFVGSGNDDAVFFYFQEVAFGLLRNPFPVAAYHLVAFCSDVDAECSIGGLFRHQRTEQGQGGSVVQGVACHQPVLPGDADGVVLLYGVVLGSGLQTELLCMDGCSCQQADDSEQQWFSFHNVK